MSTNTDYGAEKTNYGQITGIASDKTYTSYYYNIKSIASDEAVYNTLNSIAKLQCVVNEIDYCRYRPYNIDD